MWRFVEEVSQHVLADAIVSALIAGGVIAWMKKRASPWLEPLCWGMGGAAVLLIAVGAIRVIALPFPSIPTSITSDNVESRVKDWLERFRYSVQKVPPTSDRYFAYIATNPFGRKTIVARLKESPFDSYLDLENSVTLGSEDAQRLHALKPMGVTKFTLDLTIEMTRAKIAFATYGTPVMSVNISKTLPIADGLTEATFVGAMNDMDSGQLLLLASIPRELVDLSGAR